MNSSGSLAPATPAAMLSSGPGSSRPARNRARTPPSASYSTRPAGPQTYRLPRNTVASRNTAGAEIASNPAGCLRSQGPEANAISPSAATLRAESLTARVARNTTQPAPSTASSPNAPSASRYTRLCQN